jgi:ferrochelatase
VEKKAVLLMAYGAARDLADLERYYTHIRHGRPPSAEELANLTQRYEAIGGNSPLFAITRRQAVGLEQALASRPGFDRTVVYMGMKHAAPFIADAVRQMLADGVEECYALVLAPHFSTMSVAQYIDEAREALAGAGASVRLIPIWSWHLAPGLIGGLAKRVESALARFTADESPTILFTAHSLPERILAEHDPYPDQIQETGRAVMARLGSPSALRYQFGWQSAGRTREPWLGPDLLTTLDALKAEGRQAVLVCPVGFVSDHLEILYDIDIEAQAKARALGIHLERTLMFNDDPGFLATLADVIFGADAVETAAEAT